jgi:hypothetical protein
VAWPSLWQRHVASEGGSRQCSTASHYILPVEGKGHVHSNRKFGGIYSKAHDAVSFPEKILTEGSSNRKLRAFRSPLPQALTTVTLY